MIAAAIANMSEAEFLDWAANAETYPNCYRSSVDRIFAQADRVLAALSTRAPVEAGEAERILSWLTDCDNLVLFNHSNGEWQVRRGNVKGELRGSGPSPLAALQAASALSDQPKDATQ